MRVHIAVLILLGVDSRMPFSTAGSSSSKLKEVPIFRKGQLVSSRKSGQSSKKHVLEQKAREVAAIQMIRRQCGGKFYPQETASISKGRGWLEEWKLRHGPLARLPVNETLKRLFVTTNSQKHGGFLANCLVQNMGDHGLAAAFATTHSSGGFLPSETQLNIARDPFLLVDAGYLLHARKLDKWTHIPLDHLNYQLAGGKTTTTTNEIRGQKSSTFSQSKQQRDYDLAQEAKAAVVAYRTLRNGGCTKNSTTFHGNLSYGDAVFGSPPALGLLLEAVRALYRDIPYLVAAATDCFRVDQLRRGACRTLLFDDVQRYAGLEAFVDYLEMNLLPSLIDDALNETGWPHDDATARAFFLDSLKVDVQAHCSVGGSSSSVSSSPRLKKAQRRLLMTHDIKRNLQTSACAGAIPSAATSSSTSSSNKRGLGCGGRPERIRLLRQIDALFLGRALHRANATLYRLSAKLDPSHKRPPSNLLIPPSLRIIEEDTAAQSASEKQHHHSKKSKHKHHHHDQISEENNFSSKEEKKNRKTTTMNASSSFRRRNLR